MDENFKWKAVLCFQEHWDIHAVNFSQRLLTDCRAGCIDLILTKSISRFARNTITLLETVRELKMLEVDVFFEEQNIHTMGAEGELMMTILASYAQEESLSASENQKWRIKRNFEAGKPWDCTILGYRANSRRAVRSSRRSSGIAFGTY